MLNCVNALDQHLPITEQAGLVVADEKLQQDSFQNPFDHNTEELQLFDSRYSVHNLFPSRAHSAYAFYSGT